MDTTENLIPRKFGIIFARKQVTGGTLMKMLLWLALSIQMAFAGEVLAKPPVVVQLFDWSFAEISEALPELEEVGFTHVHVSPVQKSVENGKWWGKYQPLDYRVIDGPMGSRAELKALASRAEKFGVSLVVDVVLNHMAASPHVTVSRGRLVETQFADFSKEDFHPFAPINDWSDERQVRNRWLFGALPDLKTESPAVRAKLAAHLLDLQSCGVKGFRIDSARHIPPEDLKAILAEVKEPGLVMGEIAETSPVVFAPYLEELPEMTFFDFPWQAALAACLRGEKPMSALIKEGKVAEALPSKLSVRLLRNHDLDRGETKQNEGIDDPAFRLPENGWEIGYAALFGSGSGVPYVFVDHPKVEKERGQEHLLNREGLKEAVAFFRLTYGRAAQVFWGTKEAVAWTLGEDAFVVLARGQGQKIQSFPLPNLKVGSYRDVYSGLEVEVLDGGVLTLPPLVAMQGYAFQLVRE